MQQVSVVIIDSNRLFRQGLASLLSGEGFEVVATGATCAEAGPTAEAASVVLFDAREDLPRILGDIRQTHPKARVVLLTDALDARRLSEALEAGVDGCLLKDMSPDALAQSLRLALIGEKVFPGSLATILLSGARIPEASPAGTGRKGLSHREVQILRRLLGGDSNKAIANHLGITEATVKVHLKSLLRKINASNRTQAAIWAMNNGIEESETAAA